MEKKHGEYDLLLQSLRSICLASRQTCKSPAPTLKSLPLGGVIPACCTPQGYLAQILNESANYGYGTGAIRRVLDGEDLGAPCARTCPTHPSAGRHPKVAIRGPFSDSSNPPRKRDPFTDSGSRDQRGVDARVYEALRGTSNTTSLHPT